MKPDQLKPVLVLGILGLMSGCGGEDSAPSVTAQTTTPGQTATPSPAASPAAVSLATEVPATAAIADRVALQSSAAGATPGELQTLQWRVIAGPATGWVKATANGGAIAEFPRAGTYRLEASMTLGNGQVVKRESDIQIDKPGALTTRLEGELAMRSIQQASVGPRITTENGDIYLAYIDPSLRTVVAKRSLGTANEWESGVVQENTRDEEFHNKPAIGIDRNGFIHVVYDMHGSPWKYKVSRNPRDITQWNDRSADPTTGVSEWIPGRQITYPHMARSPGGDLWVTFRECSDCSNRDFHSRDWSGGLLKYDPESQRWQRPGGAATFLQGEAYRPQYVKVRFGFDGTMGIGWVWGLQYTHAEGSDPYFFQPNYPSYLQSKDGGATFQFADGRSAAVPLGFEASDKVISPSVIDPTLARRTSGYFGDVSDIGFDPAGNPIVSTRYHAVRYRAGSGWSGQWDSGNQIPFSGAIYRYNIDGEVIAISAVNNGRRGITVHRSRDNGATWTRFQVDASETDNALSNPVYFVDEDYFLQSGGQALRVALAYTRAVGTPPVMRVFTVVLPK